MINRVGYCKESNQTRLLFRLADVELKIPPMQLDFTYFTPSIRPSDEFIDAVSFRMLNTVLLHLLTGFLYDFTTILIQLNTKGNTKRD